jgi:peptide/nickel transport system ATP-binding protein
MSQPSLSKAPGGPVVMNRPLLAVEGLSVAFRRAKGWTTVVHDLSLSVGCGETVGLVGESGSGKTVTAMAIMGLTGATGGRVTSGSIKLGGTELLTSGNGSWRGVRGKKIAMIFQQPTRALNPAYTVGAQIAEAARRHLGMSRAASWTRAIELLDLVGIADASRRAKEYPHTFSGGMCQRVMIAMALVGEPDLLIADEPTTALDVTVQARVLNLLRDIQRETGVGMLFVTHDLGVVAEMCDRVNVFYGGEVVEEGAVEGAFMRPAHPYTAALLAAVPHAQAGQRLVPIPGNIPDFDRLPEGCRFHPRCTYAIQGRCDVEPIPLLSIGDPTTARQVRCVRSGEITLTGVTGVEPA